MLIAEQRDVRQLLEAPTVPAEPGIAWLGQAGFVIRQGESRVAIDPYLSDSLARKYRGTARPHARLMPPPLAPDRLRDFHITLCTHAHTDHMDPETLPYIAAASPACRFVVPRAERPTALARGVPEDRLVAINAGETISFGSGLVVRAVPAAHEELRTDAAGNHHYLGYVLYVGGRAIYHAGDCVPFAGLETDLGEDPIDVALLPVNGRDADRLAAGIPGNFTFQEAVSLCVRCRIPAMLACHFGMFSFNTVDVPWLDAQLARAPRSLQCVRPRLDHVYWLAPHLAHTVPTVHAARNPL